MPIRYPHVILVVMIPIFGACSAQWPNDQSVNDSHTPHGASITLNELPVPIRKFIESSNRGEATAVIECFTANAVLDDFGRRFEGHARIAAWNRTDNTGVKAHLEITSVTQSQGVYDVGVTVSGGGYNGSGHMRFQLQNARISRLTIA